MDTHDLKVGGIAGKLYRTADSPRWQLEFRHPQTTKRIRISTGLRDLVMAKEKARGMITEAYRDGLTALRAHGQRAVHKSVGEAVDHYLKVAQIDTKQTNVNRLLRMLRLVLEEDNEQVRAHPLTVVSPDTAAKYRTTYQGSAYTMRSVLSGARSVFCNPMDWRGFPLPDCIKEFAAMTKGMKAPVSTFVRIPPETLERMDASSRAIGGATRRAYLLTRYLGMTPKEVAYCRKGWIEDRGDRHVMVLVERESEGLKLKTGAKRGRVMSVPPWMVPELLAAEDFMVPGRTKGMRVKFMERNFNMWVREFLPDRRAAAYELRKQAGSDVLNETGRISLVQHMLGHKEPSTTARFYAVFDREVDLRDVWQKERASRS
jgi:integrase